MGDRNGLNTLLNNWSRRNLQANDTCTDAWMCVFQFVWNAVHVWMSLCGNTCTQHTQEWAYIYQWPCVLTAVVCHFELYTCANVCKYKIHKYTMRMMYRTLGYESFNVHRPSNVRTASNQTHNNSVVFFEREDNNHFRPTWRAIVKIWKVVVSHSSG